MNKKAMKFFQLGLILSVFTSCKITAIQPSVPIKSIPYFPAEISQVNLNINADLTKYIDDADHSVAYRFLGGEDPCQGLRYHYDVTRDPLTFAGTNNIITIKENVHFNLRAEYCGVCAFGRCIVPKISGSCGPGDGDPGFDVSYRSAINFLPTYQISTVTSLQHFNTIGSCPATIFRINALPILQNKLNATMVGLAQKVDEKISGLNYRSQVSQIWVQLNKQIPLGNLGFLNINPKQLYLSNINMTAKQLNVTLGLSCLPVINTGNQPSSSTPIPELSVCKLGDGFNLLTDITLDYNTISANFNSQVQGKEIKFGRRKFIFTKGKVYGGGNSKTIIELTFRGARKGTVYFTGTPVYDNITHKLSVPDLDFDLQTRSLLLNVAVWILNTRITDKLRNATQYDLTSVLANARTTIEASLTKQFLPNVATTCHITDINLVGIFPTHDNLIIRPSLIGDLSVDVK